MSDNAYIGAFAHQPVALSGRTVEIRAILGCVRFPIGYRAAERPYQVSIRSLHCQQNHWAKTAVGPYPGMPTRHFKIWPSVAAVPDTLIGWQDHWPSQCAGARLSE